MDDGNRIHRFGNRTMRVLEWSVVQGVPVTGWQVLNRPSPMVIRPVAILYFPKQEANGRPIHFLAWNQQTGQEDYPLAINCRALGLASNREQRFLPHGFSSIQGQQRTQNTPCRCTPAEKCPLDPTIEGPVTAYRERSVFV